MKSLDPLVSVEWLAERYQQPDLVVLDATLPPVGVTPVVDTHARYLAQHIPGAVFFDIEALSDRSTSLPHMLPGEETFTGSMEALGIGSDRTVVVYEQEGVFSAPRARWMLRTMGVEAVYLLDGGLRAWIAAGLPTTSGAVVRDRTVYHSKRNDDAIRNFTQVESLIASHGQILDARSAGRFAGTAPEPRPGLPSGHMPGAISLPFTDLVTDGRLKPVEQLQEIFASRGVDLRRPITTSCGSGVTAAVLALALERVWCPRRQPLRWLLGGVCAAARCCDRNGDLQLRPNEVTV